MRFFFFFFFLHLVAAVDGLERRGGPLALLQVMSLEGGGKPGVGVGRDEAEAKGEAHEPQGHQHDRARPVHLKQARRGRRRGKKEWPHAQT